MSRYKENTFLLLKKNNFKIATDIATDKIKRPKLENMYNEIFLNTP